MVILDKRSASCFILPPPPTILGALVGEPRVLGGERPKQLKCVYPKHLRTKDAIFLGKFLSLDHFRGNTEFQLNKPAEFQLNNLQARGYAPLDAPSMWGLRHCLLYTRPVAWKDESSRRPRVSCALHPKFFFILMHISVQNTFFLN